MDDLKFWKKAWVKKLTRKTIFFSKSIKIHDIVIGLLINVLDFGLLL